METRENGPMDKEVPSDQWRHMVQVEGLRLGGHVMWRWWWVWYTWVFVCVVGGVSVVWFGVYCVYVYSF